MEELNQTFQKTRDDYLAQLNAKWPDIDNGELGVSRQDGSIEVPFFNHAELVDQEGGHKGGGLFGHMVSVILFKYLLGPYQARDLGNGWVAFREFLDAAPLASNFSYLVEQKIAVACESDAERLKGYCKELDGIDKTGEYNYDLALEIKALPKVPMLLLFNASDDVFPASCTVLFKGDAAHYLDMECLVMCGMCLSLFIHKQADLDDAPGRNEN